MNERPSPDPDRPSVGHSRSPELQAEGIMGKAGFPEERQSVHRLRVLELMEVGTDTGTGYRRPATQIRVVLHR